MQCIASSSQENEQYGGKETLLDGLGSPLNVTSSSLSRPDLEEITSINHRFSTLSCVSNNKHYKYYPCPS